MNNRYPLQILCRSKWAYTAKKSFLSMNVILIKKSVRIFNTLKMVFYWRYQSFQLPLIALTASRTETVPSPSLSIRSITFLQTYPTRFSIIDFSSSVKSGLSKRKCLLSSYIQYIQYVEYIL